MENLSVLLAFYLHAFITLHFDSFMKYIDKYNKKDFFVISWVIREFYIIIAEFLTLKYEYILIVLYIKPIKNINEHRLSSK